MGFEGVRLVRATMLVIGAIMVFGGAAAASAKPRPVAPGSRYLALGDSVTFGYKEATVVPPPNYHDAASFLGYPGMVGRQLRMVVTNPACPGETSASFINAAAISNGCENILGKGQGYRDLFPLHVKYKGSQLAFALSYLRAHRNVRLVSLMIGANDVFVCEETSPQHCLSAAERNAVFRTIARNVRTILSAIRNKAHYKGQLVIVHYYSTDYTFSLITQGAMGLNQAEDTAARPFHVAIANGFAEWRTASFRFGGKPCLAGLLTQLMAQVGNCGVHPTYAGQALLAKSVVQAVRY